MGEDPNTLSDEGRPPLATTSNYDTIKILLENGARVDPGFSIISRQYMRCERKLISLFLEYGCDINQEGFCGRTTIERNYDYAVMNFLLENGANPYLVDLSDDSFTYSKSTIRLINKFKKRWDFGEKIEGKITKYTQEEIKPFRKYEDRVPGIALDAPGGNIRMVYVENDEYDRLVKSLKT